MEVKRPARRSSSLLRKTSAGPAPPPSPICCAWSPAWTSRESITVTGPSAFNSVNANKVLVLIDGCSVYHPIFSGVLWWAQDVPLENIERIEVIRGPVGNGVGRKCPERSDQHHHEKRRAHAGEPDHRRWRERQSKPKDCFSMVARLARVAPTGSMESIPTWERPTQPVSRRPPTRAMRPKWKLLGLAEIAKSHRRESRPEQPLQPACPAWRSRHLVEYTTAGLRRTRPRRDH